MGMGMSFMSILMMMASMGPIAGDDLLGFVHTTTYWQQKSVEVTATAMLDELNTDVKAAANPKAAVRKLMAIRTLGELKATESLAALQPLTKSKELFVADYAKRAIADINGKKYAPVQSDKTMRTKDLALLPTSCGAVGQASLVFDNTQTFDSFLKSVPLPGGMTKEQVLGQMTQMALTVAEKVGNVRLDALTVGVARDVGKNTGYVVIIARGLYDAKAAAAALEPMMKETSTIGGMQVFSPAREAALLLPDNNTLILATGPRKEALPTAEIVSAVKAGKTGLQNSPEMVKLVKSVDTTATFWAAAHIGDNYRKAEMLAPLKWITLTGTCAKDAATLTLMTEATDADSLKGLLAKVEDFRQNAIREIGKTSEHMSPQMRETIKPGTEAIKSLKAVQEGAKAKITATVRGASLGQLVIPFYLIPHRMSQLDSMNAPVEKLEGQSNDDDF